MKGGNIMNLIIIRNTETMSNVQYIVGGRSNENLTERGIKQAKNLKINLQAIDYDLIYSSPVNRAIETANIINYKKLPIIIDERISERDPGNLLHTSRNRLDKSIWYDLKHLRTEDGSETLLSLINRTRAFIKELQRKYNDKTIVIVTHNSISRVFWMLNCKEKKSLEEIYTYYQSSDSIQVYENYKLEGVY